MGMHTDAHIQQRLQQFTPRLILYHNVSQGLQLTSTAWLLLDSCKDSPIPTVRSPQLLAAQILDHYKLQVSTLSRYQSGFSLIHGAKQQFSSCSTSCRAIPAAGRGSQPDWHPTQHSNFSPSLQMSQSFLVHYILITSYQKLHYRNGSMQIKTGIIKSDTYLS